MAIKNKKKKPVLAVADLKDVLLVEDIEDNVRLDFRIACMKRGLTMKQVVRDFLIKFAKDNP